MDSGPSYVIASLTKPLLSPFYYYLKEECMKKEILNLLEQKNYVEIKKNLESLNSADVAEILEEFDTNIQLLIFRLLQKDQAVEVFSHLSPVTQENIITSATDKEIKILVEELFFDDMIDLLEEMPAHIVKRILANVKENERSLVNHFLNYPINSAGSLMTIEYVDLKKNLSVKDALVHLQKTGVDKETIYTCYVIDAQRKLEGTVSLKDLVISDENKKISDIMNVEVISVNTLDDQEEVARKFKKYDLIAMPVVDKENRLVGIITVDDIMDVIDDENTEDFYKMAAISPSDENYLDTSVFGIAKQRIIWLLILMISATFTGYIIKSFETALASVVTLAMFIPQLMDTGGNAGSQSSTVIIRGIALGTVKFRDGWKVLAKEFTVSIIVGLVLAAVNFLKIFFIDGLGVQISLVVSLTLFCTVIIAKIIGGILPLLASKVRLDPAIMASPLITTIVDALALIIYFSLASMILGL